MIKPNWHVFKAKFSENPEDNFEWFCYMLFCKEHNKPLGIHRYRNQAAIETDLIEVNGEFLGWQAKFYETTLSKNKISLIDTIERAKASYPEISKLIIYTNQEWAQKNGKEPRSKRDVEAIGNKLGVELIWRTASYFEAPFVVSDNEIIARHFFSLDKSVLNLVDERQRHTEIILDEIQTGIYFNGQVIEIDRKDVLKEIEDSQQISIISGVGGVGKTAVIKKLYEHLKDTRPFYVFRANEFDLRSIGEMFVGVDLQTFIQIHEGETDTTVVIDSAEKLLDFRNTDPFKEFLLSIIRNKWKVIFTTRDSYLGDLNYQFFEIYKIAPWNIYLQNLSLDTLSAIAAEYVFSLPKDERLVESLRNPFHLRQYLKSYKEDGEITYIDFREDLWNNTIKRFRPAREQCFLQIAFDRANNGQFFVLSNCQLQVLDELKQDGILGYESPHGYFITHDIYEEWALEKIIENEYIQRSNNHDFFKKIGRSLPIRRSFRKWVSEKLFLGGDDIKQFIEAVIEDEKIESFWKDEVLISILLSDYSETFFDTFKSELMLNEQELLKKMTFLLRIACKEVDDDFFRQLGLKRLDLFSLKYILTKPRGHGWRSLIKFVFENFAAIGAKNIDYILPVLYDWNKKFPEGETTKFSSLIALRSYQELASDNRSFLRADDTRDKIFVTISNGVFEIKDELAEIFTDIIKNNWKHYGDHYYDLAIFVLTEFEGVSISKALPKQVLQLADCFWFKTGDDKDFSVSQLREREENFCIADQYEFNYFPESAYQTPIYWLLQASLQETVDFILEFVNKTTQCYAENKGEGIFYKTKVHFEEEISEQYSDGNLWVAFRGGGYLPYLLKSIHMALERFFLERGKYVNSDILESWLLHLLRQSKSASISAVVASIVLAYPEKAFNVATVLFRTKEFYFYDTSRLVVDQTQKSGLGIFQLGFGTNYKSEIYGNERLEARDDEHRKWTLENQFVRYQLSRDEKISDEEFEKRREVLWKILDDFYQELPEKDKETEFDKTWRLYLARMDTRKMKVTTEQTDKGLMVYWNLEIEPELKEFSEKSLQKSNEGMKYASLRWWAYFRMRNDEKYKQYGKYEENPKLALKEVQEVIKEMGKNPMPAPYQAQRSEEERFYLYNQPIPSDVCSVLIRDYSDSLSEEERAFCKDIILEYASLFLQENYTYQMSDGTESAISVLPLLLEEEREKVKEILLLALFNDYHIDVAGAGFSDFSILSIHQLWESHFEDAQSILLGYLFLKSKYEAVVKRLREESYTRGRHKLRQRSAMRMFLEESAVDLDKTITSTISMNDLKDIRELGLDTLRTTFLLIPLRTKSQAHKEIVKEVISIFAEKLFSRNRDDEMDYSVGNDFIKRFASFVLSSPKEEIADYLKPFLDKFNGSKVVAELFQAFIIAEDQINAYENFWYIWNLFNEKVVEVCQHGDEYWYIAGIIKSYLFAESPWNESATEWHTLQDKNKSFFSTTLKRIGHCPSALYAVSKLLNGIGSSYLNDGVSWISYMLENNKDLWNVKLETNTLYYLENLIKKHIYENREKIKKTKMLKQDVLLLLEFLIKRGSVGGYLLRENIL